MLVGALGCLDRRVPRPLKPLVSAPAEASVPLKKPEWFKIKLQRGDHFQQIESILKDRNLHTVCQEARCPNIFECWNSGTATFMLMGDTCTRACKFCHVKTGNPKGLLDEMEPLKIAQSIADMNLSYIVLTSVDRDDLVDEGSEHFAKTVRAIKELKPEVLVECLTPDFRKTQESSIQRMIDSGVDVLAHNIETVRRLVPQIRDARCRHDTSLQFHREAKRLKPSIVTKSSIMLGLGETKDEVLESMKELRDAQVDVLTLGQYLQPTKNHHPVMRYWLPSEFKWLEEQGLDMGFRYIAAGPMVRSSYKAGEFFIETMLRSARKDTQRENIQFA